MKEIAKVILVGCLKRSCRILIEFNCDSNFQQLLRILVHQALSMDLKVMPGKMTKLEKEANSYGQIHCVDVSTYKEVEWVQEKRRKCTSSFPKKAIEKTETVSRKFISMADHRFKTRL